MRAIEREETIGNCRLIQGDPRVHWPARHKLWFRLHDELGYCANEIAKMFGRDHTTILSAYKEHKEQLGEA